MFPENESSEELEAILLRLKRQDYAGYLTVRFSPLDHRAVLCWLFGFLMDVEQISLKVNEPLLGEIRLQWWRDQLLKLLRGEKVGHPVADGLAPFFESSGEPLFKELIGIVDSYSFEIQKEPIKTKAELLSVLEKRYGGFLRAALILTKAEFAGSDELSSHAGTALGMGVLLAELNSFLHRDIMPLPQDVLSRHDLYHEDFLASSLNFEGKTKEADGKERARAKVLAELVDGVMISSWDVKAQMKKVPKAQKTLFARWLLVSPLVTLAIRERAEGQAGITTLNPLKIFFTLCFKR